MCVAYLANMFLSMACNHVVYVMATSRVRGCDPIEENRRQKTDVIRSTEIGIQDATSSVPVSGASLN